MHLDRANLHLEGLSLGPNDRGVDRLVHVGSRNGNEVLDSSRHRLPEIVNDAQSRVAVLYRAGNDAQGKQIIHLLDGNSLALDLLMGAVDSLDAGFQGAGDFVFLELLGQPVLDLLQQVLPYPSFLLDFLSDLAMRLRVQGGEGKILELAPDLSHAQAVSDGSVDFHGLLGNPLPSLHRKEFQSPHIVEPVGQLDQDDSDVVHHGQEHLAKILRLAGFLGVKAELVDLGEPVDDVGNVLAEFLFDLLQRSDRVLHDVVQQSHADTTGVELHVGQDIGHGQRMVEVRLTRFTRLSIVLFGRKAIGLPQHLQVVGRMGSLGLWPTPRSKRIMALV